MFGRKEKPLAHPWELRVPVAVFRQTGDEKTDHGVPIKSFTLVYQFRCKINHQKAKTVQGAHTDWDELRQQIIGWWSDFCKIQHGDRLIVNMHDHFVLNGSPINWKGQNTFGMLNSISAYTCGSSECECATLSSGTGTSCSTTRSTLD